MVRGLVAGAVAGLAAFVVAYLFAQPSSNSQVLGSGVQSTVDLATRTMLFGLALGVIFALIYAVIYGRVGRLTPRATAAVAAAVGFTTTYFVPFLKYPANPPGAGDPVNPCTWPYLAVLLISLAVVAVASLMWHTLTPHTGTWNATITAAASYVAVMWLVGLSMPPAGRAPPGFPADVLYQFRMAAVGGAATFWAVLGILFGALIDTPTRPDRTLPHGRAGRRMAPN